VPVPADHDATAKAIGFGGVAKMMSKAVLNYRRTMWFLARQRRFRDLYNFFYTKTLVPTGEGSGELAYYFIGGLLQKYPRFAPYPRNIEVEMSTYCNKKCITCEHTFWREPSRHLRFDQFKTLVDQFPLRWINMTGEGDAFLNPDYLKEIAYLKAKGVSVYLVDSFDLVTPAIARQLVHMQVDGIYLSMDGASKKTYEAVKVGCSYEKVLDNISAMLRCKEELRTPLPELSIRYVINNQNMHEMAKFVQVISSLGPKRAWGDGSRLHFSRLLDYPEIHHLYPGTIPEEYVREAAQVAAQDPNSLTPIFARTDTHNPSVNRCLAWMEPYLPLVPHPMVVACCALMMSNDRARVEKYSFGDYTKEPFKSIWNHPYYKWFRRTITNPNMPVPAACAGCRAYDTETRVAQRGVDERTRENFE